MATASGGPMPSFIVLHAQPLPLVAGVGTQYVDALQEQLYELSRAPEVDRPPPYVLDLYKQHIDTLASALLPTSLPSYARAGTADRHISGGASVPTTPAPSTPGGPRPTPEVATSAAPRTPLGQQALGSAGAAGGASAVGQGTRQRLRVQQALQDDLTGELLDMTADLKASALAMQNAIRFRGSVVDDAAAALDDSLASTKAAGAKAKQQYKSGRIGFCRSLAILLVMMLMFTSMVVYIRVTALWVR